MGSDYWFSLRGLSVLTSGTVWKCCSPYSLFRMMKARLPCLSCILKTVMTKFPILLKTAKKTKHPQTPPIKPLRPYEEMVGWRKFWRCWLSASRPSGSGFCSMRCTISAMRRLGGGAVAPRPQSMRALRVFKKSFSNFSADRLDDYPGMMATR